MKFCALKANSGGFARKLPVLGSHGGDAGNWTSMSSASGEGEAKWEVEESLLRWGLHGGEGFGLTS